MNTDGLAEDLPSIVAEEIAAAQQAGIPLLDQPNYVADRLRYRIAGTDLYVRKSRLSAAEKRELLKREFTGNNLAEAAAKAGVSPRRARQILYGR